MDALPGGATTLLSAIPHAPFTTVSRDISCDLSNFSLSGKVAYWSNHSEKFLLSSNIFLVS